MVMKLISEIPSNDVKLSGRVSWKAKDKDGNVVDSYDGSNNILLQIRQPIIKLLGAFGNVQLAASINGGDWNKVPDTYTLLDVHGNVGLQVVPTTLPYVARIAFGSSDKPATIYDTDLEQPISGADKILATAPIFSPDGLQVTFAVLVDMNELNDVEIREAVLRTVDGTAIARSPIGYYRKIPGMYWEFMWTIGYSDKV